MYGTNIPTTFAITVSGGTGTKTLDLYGKALGIGVKAPSTIANYDIEAVDVDGFGITLVVDATGNLTIPCATRFYGPHTFTISNATDGTYMVKIWFE